MVRTFQTHRIRKQTELTQLWSFSDGGGERLRVSVPSCWESYPGLQNHRGSGAYETEFEGEGNLRVVCKGVSHTADVYVDGERIAHHYNAYTPFDGIVRGAKPGAHRLRIEVSNAFSEDSALHIPNDYMSYGGITRPVTVEQLPDAFIEWVHATPRRDGGAWRLDIQAKVRNIGSEAHRAALSLELNGQRHALEAALVPADGEAVVGGSFSFGSVERYSPQNPALYLLACELHLDGATEPSDDLIERVGFREVRVQGQDILLNGEKVIFKGVCRHEDHPQFGCALPFAAMDYDLNLIMDLGCNAVRTVHYPNDELFLDLCDEKGILVWEENHARGLDEARMRNPHFRAQCEACTGEMVQQHFNHPSIIIWGILNECASDTAYGKDCYQEQFRQIKRLDASRPTSFASCMHFQDISLDLPDIVSYNIYPEWYHDAPVAGYLNELYQWVQQTEGKGKPFLISEIGAGALFGYRGTNGSKWSEEYQAEALAHQIEAVLGAPFGSGLFIWQFCDVRVSDEWFYQRPRTMNNKGIVDEYRRRKLSYDVVKRLYHAQTKA